MAKLYICISVDWEGEHFKNLHDLAHLRKSIGVDTPVTHFICPSYFTIKDKQAVKKIESILQPVDEIGLHIHCYKSLIEAAEVEFRTQPNYYHEPLEVLSGVKQLMGINGKVSGRGVPLSAYNYNEIQKIVRFSKKLLIEKLGFEDINSFRAGGWIATDEIFNIITNEGFEIDSSAVPPEILSNGYTKESSGNMKDDYGDQNGLFTEMVLKIWGYQKQTEALYENLLFHAANNHVAINRKSQPFQIGNILEIPNNGGLSDFASVSKTMRPVFEHGLEYIEKTGQNYFMTIGCHQEGGYEFKYPLLEFVHYIQKLNNKSVEFVRISDVPELMKMNSNNLRTSGSF